MRFRFAIGRKMHDPEAVMKARRLRQIVLLLAGLSGAAALEAQMTAIDYLARGSQNRKSGNIEAALADFSKAIELDPHYAVAYNSRAAAKRAEGDLDGALADFTKAVELNPQYAVAYSNRGVAKLAASDFNGAIADYTKAIQWAPDVATLYFSRGDAKRARGDFDGAEADYKKAGELNPALAAARVRNAVTVAKSEKDFEIDQRVTEELRMMAELHIP